MINQLQSLGRTIIHSCASLGRAGQLLSLILTRLPRPWRSFPWLVREIYSVGVLSLIIIVVSSLFIGMVVALQGFHTLEKFAAESELGPLVALSVVRELGPVVTALLFAGRAGSALTAEIGLMKTTEQLDGMEMMAVDPIWRIITPRFWACFYALPMLALIFCMVSIWGGYLVGVEWLGLDAGTYWSNMQESVDFNDDVLMGFYKTVVFSLVVGWIAVYQGYDCVPNAQGMSRATTKTVVYSSLAILGLDFVLTAVMIGGW